jgi:predicted RNase H-like HicB family nuclease
MNAFAVIIERDIANGLFVGHVPGIPGAHSQGATLEELERNLREVLEMLSEDGPPVRESEFVGVRLIEVA